MIDEDLEVYLIEVNTNPCLDTSPCPLLRRLITTLLDQTFKVCLDPFLSSADPMKQEHYYGVMSGVEMSIDELQYEMVCTNAKEVKERSMCHQKTSHHESGEQI